ncbi:MAG: transposase [Candidatus Cryosericum sp.]
MFASHQCSEHALLLSLKDRGLAEVDLVTGDKQGGLTKAIRKHCYGVSWQHCHSHFLKNTVDRTPKKLQPGIKVTLSGVYPGPDLNEAIPPEEPSPGAASGRSWESYASRP